MVYGNLLSHCKFVVAWYSKSVYTYTCLHAVTSDISVTLKHLHWKVNFVTIVTFSNIFKLLGLRKSKKIFSNPIFLGNKERL